MDIDLHQDTAASRTAARRFPARVAAPRPTVPVTAAEEGSVELVRVGDDQIYAAAELVRRGLASRVVIANGAIDEDLPDDWEVAGTPIHLERLPGGRSILVAGQRPGR